MDPGTHRPDGREHDEPRVDHHDPTAGLWGAPPAASALTLRAWLAAGGFVGSIAGIIATAVLGGPVALTIVLIVVALTAAADGIVIAARRRRDPAGRRS